tara:strand:- start:106 stop:519 length:414 start_codon:yes stop_codon:yes gene_type:complete
MIKTKELKKDVVRDARQDGTWTNKMGKRFYRHVIEMDNGDIGEYSSATQEQSKFIIGEETEYELNRENPDWIKIKPIYKEGIYLEKNNNGLKNDNVQELIVRQSSLKASVDYCDNDKCSPEEICETAQIFTDWVFNK